MIVCVRCNKAVHHNTEYPRGWRYTRSSQSELMLQCAECHEEFPDNSSPAAFMNMFLGFKEESFPETPYKDFS